MSDETTPAGGAEQDSAQTGSETVTEKTTDTKAAETTETGKTADAEQPDKANADQSTDEQKPSRKSAKERIAELTAKAHAAKRGERDAINRAKSLEDRLKTYETPAPKENDYKSFEEFQAATTAHHVRQATKQDREFDIETAKETAKTAASDAQAAQKEAFLERANDFAERVTDYHQKVADPSLPITAEMANEIHASEKGPEIAYFLANNRAEAARIAVLTDPREVARAIGRIEGRIGTPPPRKVTSAPAPVKAVATGSGTKQGFDPHAAGLDDMRRELKRTGVLT